MPARRVLVVDDDATIEDSVAARLRAEGYVVSVASDGTQANGSSFTPSISADGNVIAFRSDATNLVSNDTEGFIDVFVHTMSTGKTVRVSQQPSGVGANRDSIEPSIFVR